MKKVNCSTLVLILVFLLGLGLLLYPTVSDRWNARHQTRAITEYVEQVAALDDERYAALWDAAREYNAALAKKENRFVMSTAEREEYEALLNVSGNGIMGYVEIPGIGCTLPIYHGTGEAVLQIGAGHLEGSSLPVGGAGTHCVLSGHRGLPSARLFTDLDKLSVGDRFTLRILDETLSYEVDQILIVEPNEVDALAIEAEKDYCTLVTCTPYGINSHRLLVRGHRAEHQEQKQAVRVTADAAQVKPTIVTPMVAAPMLLVLLIALLIGTGRKKKRKRVRCDEMHKTDHGAAGGAVAGVPAFGDGIRPRGAGYEPQGDDHGGDAL